MLTASHSHAGHELVSLEAVDFLRLMRCGSVGLQFLLQFLNLRLVKLVLPLQLLIRVLFMVGQSLLLSLGLLFQFLDLFVLSSLCACKACLQVVDPSIETLHLRLLLLVLS